MASASAGGPMPTVAVAARRRLAPPVPVGALPPGSEGAPVIYPGMSPFLRHTTPTTSNTPVLEHAHTNTPRLTRVGRTPPKLPYPDIGHLAKWSVSSFKFGFGPECLTDDDPETFWQYVPSPSNSRPQLMLTQQFQLRRASTALHHHRVPAQGLCSGVTSTVFPHPPLCRSS